MKFFTTSFSLIAVVISMFGCGGAPTHENIENNIINEYASGKKDAGLKARVSTDTKCPAEKVKVLQRKDEVGVGFYTIEACGKNLNYKRTGSIFHTADKNPM